MVAAPLALAAVEGGAAANGDEHVLEHGAARVVRVHVAGGDRRDTERRRKLAERDVAPRIAALVRPLQLDEEAVAPEDAGEPRRRVRIADGEAVSRAAGQADEPLVLLLEQCRVERRRQRRSCCFSGSLLRARARMCRREQPAEVRVPLLRFDQQCDVRPAVQCHLRAGDRADAEVLRRVRELERAVDTVVVGERERLVPELRRPRRQLLRLGGAVEERVGAVGVQLGVAHPTGSTRTYVRLPLFVSSEKVWSCDRRARLSSRLRSARLRDGGLLRAPRLRAALPAPARGRARLRRAPPR